VLLAAQVVLAQSFGGLVGADNGVFNEIRLWVMVIGAMFFIAGSATIYFQQAMNAHTLFLAPGVALVGIGMFLVGSPGLAIRIFRIGGAGVTF
jgi:hypothetical protein